MKKYLILLACVFTLNANAQTTQDAKDYINTNIITNGTGAITGSKMNTALNKIITAVDSLNFLKKIDTTDIDISNGNFFLKLDTTELDQDLEVGPAVGFGYKNGNEFAVSVVYNNPYVAKQTGVANFATGEICFVEQKRDAFVINLENLLNDFKSFLALGIENQMTSVAHDSRIQNHIYQNSTQTRFYQMNQEQDFWNNEPQITPLEINNGYIKPTVPTYATDTDADNDTNLCNGCMYQLTGDRGYYRKP